MRPPERPEATRPVPIRKREEQAPDGPEHISGPLARLAKRYGFTIPEPADHEAAA